MKQDAELPGHRRYSEKLRAAFSKRLLVMDNGDIPSTFTPRTVLPCWQEHPGLCRTCDAWCFEEVAKLNACVEKIVFGADVHPCFIRFTVALSRGH
jgi:hypothetical protein